MLYPWQHTQWKEIMSCYSQNRLPQALLLVGSHGLGKVHFARKIAEFLFCERKDKYACGECKNCRLFQAQNHPDFFEIRPEKEGKLIKIDQIRKLIHVLNQTPQCADFQVAIIQPAEAMHRAAANAILKILEEPSGNVLFILINHQWGILLPTIVSRCQRLIFNSCSDESTVEWLKQKIDADTQEAQQLLNLANQLPLRAVELSELNFLPLRNRILTLILKVILEQAENIVNLVEVLLKEDPKLILEILMIVLMDICRLHFDAKDFIINKDQLSVLQQLASVLQKEKILLVLKKLQDSWQLVQGAIAVNIQLLLEEIFFSLEVNDVC